MRIYTKTGDGGTTALIGGKRVGKNHPNVRAYGAVDELSAHVAHLRDSATGGSEWLRADLLAALKELMNVSARLACDDPGISLPDVGEQSIVYLEERIDSIQAELPFIDKFTIPGGHPLSSLCHIARTVCRRAEREACSLDDPDELYSRPKRYLNRLSDYLYVAGRKILQEFNIAEELWTPGV